MAKRLPSPAEIQRVRLDLDKQYGPDLDMAAAKCGLSLASFARLAIEMLVSSKDESVSLAGIKVRGEELTNGIDSGKPIFKKSTLRKGKK